jgi:hypothetical protein
MRLAVLFSAALLALRHSSVAGAEVPLPPPRPPELGPDRAPVAAAEGPLPDSPDDRTDVRDACLRKLADLGAKAEFSPPLANGVCGANSPLKLTGLPGGLEVSPPAIVTCAVAEALAQWTAGSVKTEAERHVAEPPSKILIGTSYECRSQNRQPGAKLSEHAFANAVDVMGFVFPKRPAIIIVPREDESPESLFQAAVRQGACAHFTTVLGPGTDAAHANHLHLDMRERKRGAKLCQ